MMEGAADVFQPPDDFAVFLNFEIKALHRRRFVGFEERRFDVDAVGFGAGGETL